MALTLEEGWRACGEFVDVAGGEDEFGSGAGVALRQEPRPRPREPPVMRTTWPVAFGGIRGFEGVGGRYGGDAGEDLGGMKEGTGLHHS